ncbi:adenosylcobinamide-phosphate synthase CbiB [Paenibacillus sp. CMAA1364]
MMGWAIFMLWAAYVLDLIIGDPRSIPHPVIGMGKGIKQIEKLIRRHVSHPGLMQKAGILLPVIVVGGSLLITWVLLRTLYMIHPWLSVVLEVVLIATTIATKGLKDAGMEVYDHLKRGDLPAARQALGMIVGRDTDHLDESEVVRGTVETMAENIVDAIVSPLFYAFIGGAPLAIAYRAINTLDSMVGYKNDKYINLGWASARLDDVANFIPARITGMLLVVSSWLLRLDYKGSYRTIIHDARLHPSPNSGYPESAVAGALGIRLGGENTYHGVVSFRAYMGVLSRPLSKDDIQSTGWLMIMSSLLFLVLCSIVVWGLGITLWR